MIKKLLSVVALIALGVTTVNGQSRQCAAHEKYEEQLQNPKFQHRMEFIEQSTQDYITAAQFARENGRLGADGITVYIPVVVHVIYKTTSQNISTAQIQSQIDVLNEDFAALNSDYGNTPSEFASVASGNTNIQFELATEDPSGASTTGITRKYSNTTSWGTNDNMKKSSQGGVDPWPTGDYLNIWVCNIGGGILGYAQFPGGDPNTDGVVVGPNYFGSSDHGTGFYLSSPFDLGRTTTHEIGHWLNLRHIWGDGPCLSDYVDDTPTAAASNNGCPSHPSASCSSNDMFMNYMDYVNDDCMYMFSAGQEDRMRAVFFGTGAPRASFVASGGGGGGTSCNDTEVTLTLTTDNYASETSWSLKTAGGTTLYSGSGYANNTTYNETFCLADGDYEFVINDSYGDGICCSYGSGSYDVSDATTSHASGGSFGSSETTAFTISTGGGGGGTDPAPTGYCSSQGNNTNDEYINRVEIGGLDNTSGNNGGYADYTSMSTSMASGSNQNVVIHPTWTGTVYSEAYRVWIDYNRDGDFSDANELVFNRNKTTSSNISGSFTVPSSVSEGYTRMRVSMKYNASPSTCETFTYGEVEDYEVLLSNSAKSVAQEIDQSLTLFPNPASSNAQLNFVSPVNQEVQWTLVNVQGKVIYSQTEQIQIGQNVIDINLEQVPAGMYIVTIAGETVNSTRRLAKQ